VYDSARDQRSLIVPEQFVLLQRAILACQRVVFVVILFYLLAGLANYGRLLSIASLQMVVAVDVWMATTERDLKR